MKKLLALTLTLASLGFLGLGTGTAEAKTNAITNGTPQVRIQIGPRRHRDRYDRYDYGYRTRTETRIVQRGWHTYRETYTVRYLPNGRIDTDLISRQRID